MDQIIRLTKGDLAELTEIADARTKAARKAGLVDRAFGGPRGEATERDLKGLIGEYAAAKYLGVPFSPVTDAAGDRAAGDLTLPDGRSVEVKYTSRYEGDYALSSANMEGFRADLGVLVYPTHPTVLVPLNVIVGGWITRGRFQRVAHIVDYGYGRRLAVYQWQLEPMEDLKREVDRELARIRESLGSLGNG